MATYDVRVNFSGTDESLEDTARKLTASLRNVDAGAKSVNTQMSRGERRLENSLASLTSGSGLAATAINRFSGLLMGLAQGAVIGAVAALTTEVTKQAIVWLQSAHTADELKKTVMAQTQAWDQYQTKLDDVTVATVGVYNRTLDLAKFMSRDEAATLQSTIQQLEEKNRLLLDARITAAIPLEDRWQRKMLENSLAIAEAKKKLEDLRTLQALAPQTVAGVKAGLTKEDPSKTMRGLALQYRRQELSDLAIAEKQWQDQQLAAEREFAAEKRAIAVSNQQQTTELTQFETERRNQIGQMERDHAIMQAQVISNAINAFAATAGQKSKVLFLVSKALYVGQAIMAAYTAANMALARPHLTLADAAADAATTLNWGLANAAVVAATQLATAFPGGGGAGGGGGVAAASGAGGGLSSQGGTREVRHTVDLSVTVRDGVFINERGPAMMAAEIGPALGTYLKENGFVLGDIRLAAER